ncbi:hypothetical protein RXV86_17105 [Alisedimentitalea sp. MJ-SS2]|uniref:hypothetical protein n=1 Tax=Aliisedimentitalea sp. MJ-SS2 TaxID=3049795 RepID=UPI00290D78C6|nr:hypothetical protein [Alisedimentitalea sp. MJ-SS2]MDU8929114.1 hypothetical protein [Alisedimentitalea sp. MJ-SS2]
MRLQARLAKMEKANVIDRSYLSKLTDKELAEGWRFDLEGVGVDWEEFKKDPCGSLERRFEGYLDDEGLLARLLELIDQTESSWYELAD